MFKKLQERWKVNAIDLVLVLVTFAIGGSLCGWSARKLLLWANLDKGVLWVVLYIVVMTLLWPLCVMLVSIPLGQFAFFKNYLTRIGRKMSGRKEPLNRIAIFASGAGSNAQMIIEYFKQPQRNKKTVISLVVSNNPEAGVLKIAHANQIPVLLVKKDRFSKDGYLEELQKHRISFIVLAGFLWKLPVQLIDAYPKKILNIHPALLPGYGGKGMYGNRVHEAVILNGEKESGISIHYADELYDHGEIIYQEKCRIEPGDDADSLAGKIHLLEHAFYPKVIEEVLEKQNPR